MKNILESVNTVMESMIGRIAHKKTSNAIKPAGKVKIGIKPDGNVNKSIKIKK
jgi:hypothetical protein